MQLRLRKTSHVSFHLVESLLRKIRQCAGKNHILIVAVLRLFNAKIPVCSILVVLFRISATKANRRNVDLEREIFEAFSSNTNAFHWSKVSLEEDTFLGRNVFYFSDFFFFFKICFNCLMWFTVVECMTFSRKSDICNKSYYSAGVCGNGNTEVFV